MKEKIFEGLKTKFEGVKAEILDRIATKAAKTITTEEEVATYIEGVTFQTIIDANGDFRATEAQKSAVANYEKKHNIKDGKPVEEKSEETKQEEKSKVDENVPAWAKSLMDSNEALRNELDAIKGEKTANSRKAKLDEVLANANERIKTRYTKDFERFSFKDDEDFNTWLEETKTDIEGLNTELNTKGGGFTPPKGSSQKPTALVSPMVKARIEAKAAEPVSSAIKG